MWKFLRALGLFLTGKFRRAYQTLMENEYVLEATYDASIAKSKNRIVAMSEAVGSLVRLREDKIALVNRKTEDYNRLQSVKKGALAKARDIGEQTNPEYIRCQNAYNNADADAKRLEAEIHDLEKDIESRSAIINQKKLELQKCKKQQDDLRTEKHEAIADVLTAKQEESVNRQLAGLDSDTTDADLASAREARKQARARSKVVSELAGTDHQTSQEEFANYAQKTSSQEEFDALVSGKALGYRSLEQEVKKSKVREELC